tara:strand:+ start:3652 stop:4518 length:867 start_codon:yes stop_codon:yes gene_type:complete
MMSKLLYYFVVYPVSLLPFVILYLLSDVLAFVLEYIVKYRRTVIWNNLKNSFPEKTEKELKIILHKFYTHFSDIVLEGLKGFSLSEKEVRKRITFEGMEDFDKFYKEDRDVLVVTGHYGNWEMPGTTISLFIKHLPIALYKPLTNKFFDEKAKISRAAFGVALIAMKEFKEECANKLNAPRAFGLVTDQSPSSPDRCYWTTFLNQETGVLFGTEKYAKQLDAPVVYMSIHRQKRGYYNVKFTTLVAFPNETSHGEITEKHTKFLEKDINAKPENWLWSHKRWKHKKPN